VNFWVGVSTVHIGMALVLALLLYRRMYGLRLRLPFRRRV
jgi:hypothetical protein